MLVVGAGFFGSALPPLITVDGISFAQSTSQPRVGANDDEAAKFSRTIFALTEDTWQQLFKQMGET